MKTIVTKFAALLAMASVHLVSQALNWLHRWVSGSEVRVGFTYLVEHVRGGVVIDRELVHNLVPTEGLNYILESSLRGGAALSTWYIALFEGNYTPVAGVTASSFPAAATESTAYDQATRVSWVSAAASAGSVTNSASKAVFTINAVKTIYGLAQSSVAAKSATSGVLASVARFTTPKAVEVGDELRVTSTITMTSA
jgi:hypothetical protein